MKIQTLHDDFKLYQNTVANSSDILKCRVARSRVLTDVGTYYEWLHPQEDSQLKQNLFQQGLSDNCLVVAEQLLEGQYVFTLLHFHERLKPFAQHYVKAWNDLKSCLTRLNNTSAIENKIHSFVFKHLEFMNQFNPLP